MNVVQINITDLSIISTENFTIDFHSNNIFNSLNKSHTHTHPLNGPFSKTTLGEPVPER